MAVVPLIAIATAEISVAGAAFGARRYESLPIIHSYSTKLGLVIGVATAIITGLFAPQITAFFTYRPGERSPGSDHGRIHACHVPVLSLLSLRESCPPASFREQAKV